MPPIPRPNPELMTIGDSLAQGCRSLSVKAELCQQSWSARLAQAQGWEYIPPDFPRPILIDLEEEIRRLDTLTLSVDNFRFRGVKDRIRDNLAAWLSDPPDPDHDCFDNLSLSGALVYDLYSRSAGSSAATVRALTPQGADTPIALKTLGDLHISLNGRFTLNPARVPEFDDFTPLDWVRLRRPKRLFVQAGHNHGLYEIGSQAEDVSFTQPGGDGLHGGYWDQWQTLAAALAALPAEVELIVVALLPRVGAVANLEPREASRIDGYAPTYGPVFSLSTAILPGERLADIDRQIAQANDRIQQVVGGAAAAAGNAGRVKFLDVFSLLGRFDFKNSLDAGQLLPVAPDVAVDNRYVSGRFHLFPLNAPGWRLSAGGLQSVDGMHPSGCGYAQLAIETAKLLGLPAPDSSLLQTAFVEDTLLSHYPPELRAVTSLFQIARDLQRSNAFFMSKQTRLTDDLHAGELVQALQNLFHA